MSKHTEGPWNASGTGNHQGLVISEATGANVAVTYDGEADTDLIAAAPDLLAACKIAIHQCGLLLQSQGWNERWDSITGGEWAGPAVMHILDAADAAIRKAEGGQR